MAITEPVYTFNKTSSRITEFKGYNARGVREDGEMQDMAMLTSDDYPMLSTAKRPGDYGTASFKNVVQMLSKSHIDADGNMVEVLYVVAMDDSGKYRLYKDEELIDGLELSKDTQMSAINDKICFFPEKKWYKVRSGEIGDISATTGDVNRTITIGDDEDNNYISSVLKFDGNPLGLKEKFNIGDVVTINCESAGNEKILVKKTSKNGTFYGSMVFNEYDKDYWYIDHARDYNLVGGADEEEIDLSGMGINGNLWYGLHDNGETWTDTAKLPYPVDSIKVSFKTFSGWTVMPANNVTATLGSDKQTVTIKGNKYSGSEYIVQYKIEWTAPIRYLWTAVSGDYTSMLSDVYISSESFTDDESALIWAADNVPYTLSDMTDKLTAWTKIVDMANSKIQKFTPSFSNEMHYLIKYGEFTSSKSLYGRDSLYIPFFASEVYSGGNSKMALGINGTTAIIQGITDMSITFPDGTFIDTEGKQLTGRSELVNIEVSRPSPSLDYLIEWNNRLWGCSNSDNTIYASKLGDPTNWQYYQSTALDSYFAEQGSNGRWTGVGKYSTHLLFFKEDCVHKVYGNYPSEFQVVTQMCSGVKEGSSKSVITMEDGVFYHSRRGIMGYSGGIPSLISKEFGNVKYSDAVAGTDGSKYYVSFKDPDGKWQMFVYDVELGMWHRYTSIHCTDMEYHKGDLRFAKEGKGLLNQIGGVDHEYYTSWYAVFGPFDEYVEEHKIYSVVKIRYKKDSDAQINVKLSIDEGEWEEVELVTEENENSGFITFVPERCDRFSIRVYGTGRCQIKSITREFRQGTMIKENY